MIYDDLTVFDKIYSEYRKYLLDIKNHVVFLLVFSEDEDTILANLKKEEGIDIERRRDESFML
jgi:hypothetical protein